MGGGYIAVEFAGVFNALGGDVTLVNRSDTILRAYEQEVVNRLPPIMEERGIDMQLGAQIANVDKAADGSLSVQLSNGVTKQVDQVLVATGRKPVTEGLGLESAGVELGPNDAILVDEYSKSSCDSIYAVGDVTDRVQLTPVAIREGHAFADTIFGDNPRAVDHRCIATAIFSQPSIASVGMTEDIARETYGEIDIYRSDFPPNEEHLFRPDGARALQDDLRCEERQGCRPAHDRPRKC